MLNALTFDVEEHYHLCGLNTELPMEELRRSSSLVVPQTERVLDLLSSKKIKATFFVLGSVAEQNPGLVKRIEEEGHEIASHGYQHELVYEQTREAFERDVTRALRQLAQVTRRPILGYRAASFSITKQAFWAFEVLARHGFRYDCSLFPIHHPRYGVPDAPRIPHTVNGLTEFPLSTVRYGPLNVPVAGGAYFRLLPFSFVRHAYRRLNREGTPIQLYLHPWELDEALPRLAIRWDRAFTHYANLDKTADRLRQVLDEFPFGTVQEVLGFDGR